MNEIACIPSILVTKKLKSLELNCYKMTELKMVSFCMIVAT